MTGGRVMNPTTLDERSAFDGHNRRPVVTGKAFREDLFRLSQGFGMRMVLIIALPLAA
jgi:hypothetical protein